MQFSQLGITSDSQLLSLAKKAGMQIRYIGFAEDMRSLEQGISIINLGDQHRGGSHWTLLLYPPQGNLIYFDSYGVGPEDSIVKLAKEAGKHITYSTKQLQGYNESHCGIWVLMAAKDIWDSIKKEPASGGSALSSFVDKYTAV